MMKTTDEIYGPIIGTKVRYWRSCFDPAKRAATAMNVDYPKENPWIDEIGYEIIRSNHRSDKSSVRYAEGTVIGSTEKYAVISVEHRLTTIPWNYLWTEE